MSRVAVLLAGASLVVGLVAGGLVGYIIGNNAGRKEAPAVAGTGPADTVALFPQLNRAKENEARIKAAQIAKAVGIYMTDHDGTPPPSLNALLTPDAVGGPWIASSDGILDPWGKQYQMDPSGPKHKGGEPDVWTTAPGGKTVGNFKTN